MVPAKPKNRLSKSRKGPIAGAAQLLKVASAPLDGRVASEWRPGGRSFVSRSSSFVHPPERSLGRGIHASLSPSVIPEHA